MLSKKIVKYIQSLSHKKFRDEEEAFIAEGPKVVEELLVQNKMKCLMVCAEKDWLQQHSNLLLSIPADKIYETDDHWLKSISQLKTPNKVVAVFQKNKAGAIPSLKGKISIMLDDLQDPGNLGTIIRIADWFAIENIICSENSVEVYNPKVVQSTMGSIARVNVFYTDLEKWISKNKNVPVFATTLSGTSIFQLPKISEGIILIGNESKGIHSSLLQHCSQQITIPRFGHAESLNAAVASGIIISQLVAKAHL
ncbi:MAG TPA: RNA methyltransferase [Hanamia sp.]|nr:RNA methyltransferase [Hanamia sp.]